MPFFGNRRVIDCREKQFGKSMICHLLPIGLPFDVTEYGKNGKTYTVHVSSYSKDAVIYLAAIVVLYISLFGVLLYIHFKKRSFDGKKKRKKVKKSAAGTTTTNSCQGANHNHGPHKKLTEINCNLKGDIECHVAHQEGSSCRSLADLV